MVSCCLTRVQIIEILTQNSSTVKSGATGLEINISHSPTNLYKNSSKVFSKFTEYLYMFTVNAKVSHVKFYSIL